MQHKIKENYEMTKKQNKENILEGRLVSVILALALPIVINSFIQTLYNLVDTYWLGRLGTNSMAAITVVSPIQSIVLNFGQGITVAGAILVSQYIGAKDLCGLFYIACNDTCFNKCDILFLCNAWYYKVDGCRRRSFWIW